MLVFRRQDALAPIVLEDAPEATCSDWTKVESLPVLGAIAGQKIMRTSAVPTTSGVVGGSTSMYWPTGSTSRFECKSVSLGSGSSYRFPAS